jgi:hypothetical protein
MAKDIIAFQAAEFRIRRNMNAIEIFVKVRLQTHNGSETRVSRKKFWICSGSANSMCFPNSLGMLIAETM